MMSSVAHFSLEHYEHMVASGAFSGKFQKRVELIRGGIVEIAPIGTEHSHCVSLLTDWSYDVAPIDRFAIRIQNPIRIPINDSEPEPDVVWAIRRDYSTQHPEPAEISLLIEVADTSLAADRGDKLETYAEAGIADYWIVNLIEKQIEVFRQPQGLAYQDRSIFRGDQQIEPLALAQAPLKPSRLFAAR